jgi:hypothetical protein
VAPPERRSECTDTRPSSAVASTPQRLEPPLHETPDRPDRARRRDRPPMPGIAQANGKESPVFRGADPGPFRAPFGQDTAPSPPPPRLRYRPPNNVTERARPGPCREATPVGRVRREAAPPPKKALDPKCNAKEFARACLWLAPAPGAAPRGRTTIDHPTSASSSPPSRAAACRGNCCPCDGEIALEAITMAAGRPLRSTGSLPTDGARRESHRAAPRRRYFRSDDRHEEEEEAEHRRPWHIDVHPTKH